MFFEFFQLHDNDAGIAYEYTIAPSIGAGRYLVSAWEQHLDAVLGDCHPMEMFPWMSLDELVTITDRCELADGGPTLYLPDGRSLDQGQWATHDSRLTTHDSPPNCSGRSLSRSDDPQI
ncbi:MAG: hypothetical protein ACYCOU_15775 [Sulfobacillus sp.]